jgi:hypothetical protein
VLASIDSGRQGGRFLFIYLLYFLFYFFGSGQQRGRWKTKSDVQVAGMVVFYMLTGISFALILGLF